MEKIKVVYEWIGPNGPLNNNRVPNIYDLAASMDSVHVGDVRAASWPYIYSEVFTHFPDLFELSSAFELKENDLFIYDFQLHYRKPFESFFSYATPAGLFESARFSHKVFSGIRDGRGYLMIDVSLESFVSPNHFVHMHEYFWAHGVPLNKIIYLTGCPNAEELYNNYCNLVNVDPNNRINIIFWDSFEWQLSGRHVDDQYDIDKKIENIKKTFLSFNFRYRDHRLDILSLFYKHGLLNNSYFSMPSHNPDVPSRRFIDQVNRYIHENIIGLSSSDLENIQENILPLVIDIKDGYQDHIKLTIENEKRELSEIYNSSLISVVTETNAYQKEISLTEKVYKPIIYKHPFIIVGSRGTLSELKKKGYKTFDKWFDESYDLIDDYNNRLLAIGNICSQINSWTNGQKKKFIEETKEIVDFNYEHLRSVYRNRIPNIWYNLANGVTQ